MLMQFIAHARIKPLTIDVACGGLLLAALGLLGWLGYWPMLQEERLLHQQAEANLALSNRSSDINAEHASLQQQLDESRRRLSGLQKRVPIEPRESDFFGQVANLSQHQGVRIHGFRPVASTALNGYHAVKVAFDASGEYQTLCRFLDGLAKLSRLNHITRLHIAPQSPQNSLLTVKIETDIYFTPPAIGKGDRS